MRACSAGVRGLMGTARAFFWRRIQRQETALGVSSISLAMEAKSVGWVSGGGLFNRGVG